MKTRYILIMAATSWLTATDSACAHQPGAGGQVTLKEESPGLTDRARISGDSAAKIALKRVPKGAIKSAELEVEDGRLVYSFDLSLPGVEGIEEVLVDAGTGRVISVDTKVAERLAGR